MEKLKVKHDHKLTDIIKVCIFALFLILPILCFLPTGLYYGFNEHATNSETTTINYKYQSNEVNSLDDLVEGNIYYIDTLSIDSGLMSTEHSAVNIGLLQYENIDNSLGGEIDEISLSTYNSSQGNYLGFSIQYGQFYVYFTNATQYIATYNESGYVTFNNVVFIYLESYDNGLVDFFGQHLPQYTDYNVIESVEINTNDSISNKMYQAWQGLWQSPLYNWTENNNFQFTINAFTDVFGITQQSYITNYLNYLLSLTAIYIVLDIVLAMFKWLTHLIGEK